MAAIRFIAVALTCLLCGCASLTPEEAERDSALKKFETRPDVAGLYIYCYGWMGTIAKSNVSIDGRPLGQIASLTYLYTTLEPGTHRVTATANDTSEVIFDAEPGHNYYVAHVVYVGFFYPEVELHLKSDTDGMAGTRDTHFVQPTYREEDLQTLKWRVVSAMFLGKLLGALPAAGGAGGSLIGIGMGVPH